eukprot:scaffold47515_cov60-Phaeocystis_antarctica.AAC.4
MRPASQPYVPNLQPYVCPSGADISFLSAFPTEKEVLYPPLTRLCLRHLTRCIETSLSGFISPTPPPIHRRRHCPPSHCKHYKHAHSAGITYP